MGRGADNQASQRGGMMFGARASRAVVATPISVQLLESYIAAEDYQAFERKATQIILADESGVERFLELLSGVALPAPSQASDLYVTLMNLSDHVLDVLRPKIDYAVNGLSGYFKRVSTIHLDSERILDSIDAEIENVGFDLIIKHTEGVDSNGKNCDVWAAADLDHVTRIINERVQQELVEAMSVNLQTFAFMVASHVDAPAVNVRGNVKRGQALAAMIWESFSSAREAKETVAEMKEIFTSYARTDNP
jgi:hypothetical protein